MYEFEFARPSSVAEAVAALREEDAQALGGGQTLIPTLKQRLAMPTTLVSLGGISELKGISASGREVVVQGGTTQVDLPRGQNSGLIHAAGVLSKVPGIGFTRFEAKDVVRHPLVQRIVEAYDSFDDGSATGQ